jgi:hypothetical protein
MHRSIALLTALSLSLLLSADEVENRIGVPRVSDAPVIDGKVSQKEWRAASRVVLGSNQGHALLMHDGNYLYIGLVGSRAGIGSVCMRGKTGVRVLHASAALGTAAFEQENKKWRLTRGFTWTNRDTGDSPAALEERKKMLSTDGWFANTSAAAAPEREYQVPIRGHKEVPIVIGFMSFTPEQEKFFYWPGSVEDDCAEAQLARGFTDREYTFNPDDWGVAVLE